MHRGGVSFLLAEQNTMVALRFADFGYILENGRVVLEGTASRSSENEDVKEFYLGISSAGRKSFRDDQALPAPQALAGLRCSWIDDAHRRTGDARPRSGSAS